jgi:hypothetical protein
MNKGKHEKKNPTGNSTKLKTSNIKKFLYLFIVVFVVIISVVVISNLRKPKIAQIPDAAKKDSASGLENNLSAKDKWVSRTYAIDKLFHEVYTPCWEGAYGAIGDAYLYAVTNDPSLLKFHLVDHDLRNMCAGTWVDDRAWICLAEFYWWDFTGRIYRYLVEDAERRYLDAYNDGRLSNHEGYWSWYNWSPKSGANEKIISNSNMNEMAAVACLLYELTKEKKYLDQALLVWNGDAKYPGVEKVFYQGNGKWQGKKDRSAYDYEVPWEGSGYCTVAAALYRVTKNPKYKNIAFETAQRVMNPENGWVDTEDFYQIQHDGSGAFVNFLLDAYAIAPEELKDLPDKIGKMLEHVWTTHNGIAKVTLHREYDHGIRNGWNPYGGENGYGVGEVGTVHAQGEAVRAFGVFTYYISK